MFKKLQRKFIWGSALVLLLVITMVTGIVYWITTEVINRQTDVLLNMIIDNGGDLPEQFEFDPSQERFLALKDESVYETRFLTAVKGDSGVNITVTRIAMPKNEMNSIINRAFEENYNNGRIDIEGKRIFRFVKKSSEDGSVTLVLLDSTSRYAMQRLTMTYMSGIWLLVLILYVIVILAFSKKLIRPFVENDERQKRFITNASHELKTPLAVISANTDMTEVLSGKTEWTDSTHRQITRLNTLIEDLVVLTRADEIKEADMTDVDISAIVSETAESFRSVAESFEKKLAIQITPDLNIKCDKRSIQHVVSVLIDNAVKYCDDNGDILVSLEKNSYRKGVRISVSNTYAEGKNADTEKFFERFYRKDESHNSEKAGFGIGLSMAKEIVERMKGKMKVSYSGNTISFTVDI